MYERRRIDAGAPSDQELPQESLTNEALGPRSTMDEAPTPSSAGWMASPPCQDAWAARYPLEVGTWGEHDCAYRSKFGHCGAVAPFCARSCGHCPPAPPPSSPGPLPGAGPSPPGPGPNFPG